MQNPNGQGTFDKSKVEAEIRGNLEQEQGTARRQELLKALWNLTQPKQTADLNVLTTKAITRVTREEEASRSALRESGSLKTSC